MANPSYYLEHISGGSTTIIQPGDIGRFRANKSITNKTGMGMFPIVNSDRRYDSLLSPYDELRLYVDGVFGFGGHINRIERRKGLLDLRVVGYTDMLKWAQTNNDVYLDNSASQIVDTASTGLMQKYYQDDVNRKSIATTNHVNGDAQETFYFETDGETVFDAVKRLVSEARISAGAIPFDFYVDYFPGSSQIELYFDVKNLAASGIILNEGTDFYNTYSLINGDLDQVYNDLVVRGASKEYCPVDLDWWTENNTGFFIVNNCTRTNTTAQAKIGTYSVLMDIDASVPQAEVTFALDDTDAFDATNTPAHLMSSGNGFIVDETIEQRILYYFLADASLQGELATGGDAVKLYLEVETDSTAANKIETTIVGNIDFTQSGLYQNINSLKWYKVDLPLSGIIDSGANYVSEVTFGVEYNAGNVALGDDLYLDGLTLYNLRTIETSASNDGTSMTAYGKRSLLYSDSRIATLAAANTKRAALLAMYKDPGNTIKLPMIKSQPLTGAGAIQLGETFVVRGNELASLVYRLREVNWSPEGQSLTGQLSTYYVDRDHSIGQFTRDIQGGLNEVKRRGP